ncbi:uncharacterized protein [Diabrotica undecimpunctata]|uniref:uncharacterized protein n=1 Tax=Diabrotica undecimpunctata TaxID=50387 RepID=UPI003B63F59A
MHTSLQEMRRMIINILNVSETWWPNSGYLSTEASNLYYSGNIDNQHRRGVANIIDTKVNKSIEGFVPISERVMLLQIRTSHTKLNLIQVYAPTMDATEVEVETFYQQIEDALKMTKNREITVVRGNFNAKVGKGRAGTIMRDSGLGQQQINFRDLQLRLDRIEKLFDDFDNAQSIEASDEDYTANADTIHGIERSSFETLFFHITSAVRDFIDTNLSKPRDQAAQASNSTISSENRSINIRLPAINLPSFEGDYDNWLFFRDTFNSIIHTNTELSNIQKFHYLRLSLQVIAAETIRNLDISEATYETAWELLTDRFENKSLLVNNHIKKLFNLPNVSKNSHHNLRTLLGGFQRHLRSLESLDLDTTSWDALIIYLITTKLDNAAHKEWELSIKDDKITLPTLSNLTEFLKSKCRVLESINHQEEKSRPKFPSTGNPKSKNFLSTNNSSNYSLCKQKHLIYTEFLKLETSLRHNEAKRLRLCINCLRSDHFTKECKSSGCRKCGKIHHTLLHFQGNSQKLIETSNQTSSSLPCSSPGTSEGSNALTARNISFEHNSTTLLSTVKIKVFDISGNEYEARALLDNGSESNFISQRLLNLLRLPTTKTHFSISGINQTNYIVSYRTSVKFKSKTLNFSQVISCLVLPEIAGNLPSITFDKKTLNIPSNITLADPDFNISSPIDLLIGADIFWNLICIGQERMKNAPYKKSYGDLIIQTLSKLIL